jgi:hypothetical protein
MVDLPKTYIFILNAAINIEINIVTATGTCNNFQEFQVLTTASMKITAFWNIVLCSVVEGR